MARRASETGLTLSVAWFTERHAFTGAMINFSANAAENVIGQLADFSLQSTPTTPATASMLPTLDSVTLMSGPPVLRSRGLRRWGPSVTKSG